MSDFAFATLLRQDPAAALATLKEMIDPPSITSRFRANVGVLIGLYVVVFILFTMDVFLRLRDKKMWIFRKDESGQSTVCFERREPELTFDFHATGHLRMNLFLAFHVLLGAYSIGWIAALAMYLSPAVPRSTVIVFQLFNYLLLTVTGYAEIFALATQLPRTQSVVTFHTPARLNPVQRLFSSTLRIRLSLIILFTLLLCGTTILAVFAGLGMRREENLWKMIEGRILAASHIGWAELAYLETLKELVILKDGKGVIYWSRYLGVFYLTVTSLQQVLYIPSTLGVFRLLNRQSQHLQRSLTNLSVLRALSPNPANSSPPSTSSHSPLSPVPLPASPRNSVHSSEDTINIDKMEIDLGAKLESVRNQRSMVILQAIVTEVIAVAFFVYS
ncbi:hypothetical protein P7C70_g3330, partial [Phenoliferia sp. Uapishka_3]